MKYIYKLSYPIRALIVVVLIASCLPFILASTHSEKKVEYNPMIKFYNLSGQIITPRKMLFDRIAITSSSQTIDISAAGFTNVTQVAIIGENNTTTIGNMPITTVKSFTTTSVTFNTMVSNTAVLAILNGLTTPASFTGFEANIFIIGN